MEGSDLLFRFLAIWTALAALQFPILRTVVGGARPEDYTIAETELTARYLFLGAILSGLCLTVVHRNELLPLILWILNDQLLKRFRLEVARARRDRALQGDRRLRAGTGRERNCTLSPSKLPRKEDHPICLRSFQLRLAFYPWGS
jgi:hypothetical protein